MAQYSCLAAIAVMALAAMGLSFAILKGNILGLYGALIEKIPDLRIWKWTIPAEYIRKPLGTCNRCAVSIWGTLVLLVLGLMPDQLYHLPAYWLCAAGLVEYLDK